MSFFLMWFFSFAGFVSAGSSVVFVISSFFSLPAFVSLFHLAQGSAISHHLVASYRVGVGVGVCVGVSANSVAALLVGFVVGCLIACYHRHCSNSKRPHRYQRFHHFYHATVSSLVSWLFLIFVWLLSYLTHVSSPFSGFLSMHLDDFSLPHEISKIILNSVNIFWACLDLTATNVTTVVGEFYTSYLSYPQLGYFFSFFLFFLFFIILLNCCLLLNC